MSKSASGIFNLSDIACIYAGICWKKIDIHEPKYMCTSLPLNVLGEEINVFYSG